jgi:hypothetical protein
VHFTPQTEAQLKQFAASKGKNVAQVVEETIARMLERQVQLVEGVKSGSKQPIAVTSSTMRRLLTGSSGCFSRDANTLDHQSFRPS